ncbi:MAG TPA: 1,4-alpha-glucan branching protein GlgB [Spirochaetota bacterium]|nr:1,4-alpha-glucan branching protein GlgB [Spirochaetota bacterium]HPP04344.1 1,4-alpha-glucan branching protein GlgB [Spirochaetota bacterium]
MLTTIYATDIIGIVSSNHQSPHWILGIHPVEVIDPDGKKRIVQSVRAFLPEAKSAFVVEKGTGKEWEMDKIHNDGLFEAIIWDKKDKFKYELKITDYFGNTWTKEDPYEEWVEGVTQFDRYLFNVSQHYKIYEKMGAHVMTKDGKKGVYFAVWAPNAARVSVIGNFNGWDGRKHPMELLADSGIWVLFIPGLKEGEIYKYEIKTKSGHLLEKADPYATYSELRPKTASIVYTLEEYKWTDQKWLEAREKRDLINQPISIYEVHLGSWMRVPEEGDRFLTYREFADKLIPYVKEMGFTHIELLPIEEHPFDGSWGYQVTGYFAPTSRYGKPDDLQYFIDRCHNENIGVILDWVPGHFPKDIHGLINFDGTALYEHADPRLGEHMDWGTKIFNYGRFEVKNFLISNALYWVDKFHFDGLRVDAVASMLYLDYSRKPGEWVPNIYGGRENLEAIEFFKHLNSIIHQYFPGVLMIAEESTSFAGVTKPAYANGLGFGFKWNMGWMNDTLRYMQKDPIHRKYHHGDLTFSFLYAWSENFILPISHDEVVHGKGSIISKMPGDYWQKFANLRAFYTYMWTHPGKQLLFMGQEFAQFEEWKEYKSLDWHLLDFDFHKGIQKMIKDLNEIYKKEKALWEKDADPSGFIGINCDDSDNSVISFIRRSNDPFDFLVVVVNFTPVPRHNYLLGVPEKCYYEEIFNSDSSKYCGSNVGNFGGVMATEPGSYWMPYSIYVTVPPLGGIILKPKYDDKFFENKKKEQGIVEENKKQEEVKKDESAKETKKKKGK